MCIFCEIAKGNIPSYRVYEDEFTLAFLDINPISKGHTVIVSKNHSEDITNIDEKDLGHIMHAVKEVCKILEKGLKCEGFNVFNNCKEIAGQSVLHTHFHVIPRYKNDGIDFENKTLKLTEQDFIEILSKIK